MCHIIALNIPVITFVIITRIKLHMDCLYSLGPGIKMCMFFSSLFRFAVPLLKKGGIGLAKHVLKTGSNIETDVEGGKSFKQAARDHFTETGQRGSGKPLKSRKNPKRKSLPIRAKKCSLKK